MEEKRITALSNEELLKELKRTKKNKITNALLIGMFIGIFVYSAVKNGFGFFTFFPLIFVALLIGSGKKNIELEKEVKNELDARDSKENS